MTVVSPRAAGQDEGAAVQEAKRSKVVAADCRQAVASPRVWDSKEDVLQYFKDACVEMSTVTGVNEISVAHAVQASLGCLAAAMLLLVSPEHSAQALTPSIITTNPQHYNHKPLTLPRSHR